MTNGPYRDSGTQDQARIVRRRSTEPRDNGLSHIAPTGAGGKIKGPGPVLPGPRPNNPIVGGQPPRRR